MKHPSAMLSEKVWPIAEAKARLSEILRLAEEEGPQQVGLKNTFVIVPKKDWAPATPMPMPLGEFIMKYRPPPLPGEPGLEIPKREGGHRPIPFIDYAVD